MGQQDTTTMRVPPVILLSARQLVARLEAATGRRVFNRDAVHVAFVAAENATDEELISYLPDPDPDPDPEPELNPCS